LTGKMAVVLAIIASVVSANETLREKSGSSGVEGVTSTRLLGAGFDAGFAGSARNVISSNQSHLGLCCGLRGDNEFHGSTRV
jgi:hypothetical protein